MMNSIFLTWEEFLKLASVVKNLYAAFCNFNVQEIDIKERNQCVAVAANEYRKLYEDSKYGEFMRIVRISEKYKSNINHIYKIKIFILERSKAVEEIDDFLTINIGFDENFPKIREAILFETEVYLKRD